MLAESFGLFENSTQCFFPSLKTPPTAFCRFFFLQKTPPRAFCREKFSSKLHPERFVDIFSLKTPPGTFCRKMILPKLHPERFVGKQKYSSSKTPPRTFCKSKIPPSWAKTPPAPDRGPIGFCKHGTDPFGNWIWEFWQWFFVAVSMGSYATIIVGFLSGRNQHLWG